MLRAAFYFLMMSVNDKTEHLKGNVMYIKHSGTQN